MKKLVLPLFALSAILTYTRGVAQEPADSLEIETPAIIEEVAVSEETPYASLSGITITDPNLERDSTAMAVSMQFNLKDLKLKSNRAVILAPIISNGDQAVELPAIGIYGRNRWYQSYRTGRRPFSDSDEISYRYSDRPYTENYSVSIPYEDWMDGSELVVSRYEYGCCNDSSRVLSGVLAQYVEPEIIFYVPEFKYIRPVGDGVKTRELSGKAFVDFPVNRTELNPNFRNNRYELNKIISTIDSVRNDKDITVTSIHIQGSASPEGSYANNERLAKGRTEALKNYVLSLYNFSPSLISTSYVPEDWAGLKEYVESSTLTNKNGILQIIDDSSLSPDAKDAKIKNQFRTDYNFLLNNVYPTLRRSDYRIEYAIRTFTDVNEIRELLATNPQKLSLSEMYLLAQSLEPGSDEFNEVFEIAVRMYPSDETANLNAANSALSRNDIEKAERYLAKAGNSAEAVYARGVLAALKGDKENAMRLIREAGRMGLEDSDEILEYLENAVLPNQ